MRVISQNKIDTKSRVYFTKEVSDAIVRYNKEKDYNKRSVIYDEYIAYPFNKLVENIINTYQLYNDPDNETFKDLRHEVITFLLEKIGTYSLSKGRAYSYFGTIAKRYLIQKKMFRYKNVTSNSVKIYVEDEENDNFSKVSPIDAKAAQDYSLVGNLDINQPLKFVDYFSKYLVKFYLKADCKHINYFTNDEKKILFVLVNALDHQTPVKPAKNRGVFDIDTKKMFYNVVKSEFDVDNQSVLKTIKKLAPIYEKVKKMYYY